MSKRRFFQRRPVSRGSSFRRTRSVGLAHGGLADHRTRRLRLESLEPRTLLSAGALDPTFGVDGLVLTGFPSPGTADYDGYPLAIGTQTDGKVVTAGCSYQPDTGFDFALTRYNSDGTLDASFGGAGKLTTHFGFSSDHAYSIALQADGKIVVAGLSVQAGSGVDFAVARYNTDGTLDTSFSGDGKLTTDFAGSWDEAESLAIQADGKIVVAGCSSQPGTGYDFALARYNSDGSLDMTFDGDGKLATDFGSASDDCGYSVAIQAEGKIVVAGSSTQPGTAYDVAIARYNTDGTLDTSFGVDGKVTTDFGSSYDFGLSIAIQSNGKIVVAGWSTQPATGDDVAIARYNTDGTLDMSFGVDGKVTTDFASPYDYANSVAIQGDGKIVVAGESQQPGTGRDFALARYNSDGSLDITFGSGGKVTTDIGVPCPDYAEDLAISTQADGKMVVVGYSVQPGSGADFALARYNSDGTLDISFDGDGKVTTDFGYYSDCAYSVAVQGDGKIVVAGESERPGTGWDFALARYNSDGSLDTTFGSGGKVTIDFGSLHDYGYRVALQTDGKIVVAGSSYRSGNDSAFALARCNSDGSLDASFGTSGKVISDFGSGSDLANSVVIQADGKIVVAGYTPQPGTGADFALVRYNSDGSLDTTFDGDGKVTTDFGLSSDEGLSVAIQADGKILVVGSSFQSGIGRDFALARYNVDGSLDDATAGDSTPGDSFGSGGKVTTDLGSWYDRACSVVIQADGKIVVAGQSDQGATGYDFALARYNSDGSLDTTFDGDGKVTSDFGSLYDDSYAVAIQADGKIVVAGYSEQPDTSYDFALARYLSGLTTPGNLDEVIQNLPPGETEVEATGNPNDIDDWIAAIGGDGTPENPGLPPNTSGEVITITLTLDHGNYGPTKKIVIPQGYVLVIDGASGVVEIVGQSPAITLGSGELIVRNGVRFLNATDAPTILVEGGNLTLRGCTVEETTGGEQAAIKVLGGTLNLGNWDDYGGNTLVVNGPGEFVDNRTATPVFTMGNTYQTDGQDGFVETDLVLFATPWADQVKFERLSSGATAVSVNSLPTVTVAATGRLVAFGGDGDDRMQASGNLALAVWLYGQGGNDNLKGGAGDDVLLGGDGDDLLVGHSGRDLLIGGLGADRIVGNADDDIIIAGITLHDRNQAALMAIMAEWTRVDNMSAEESYLDRIDKLQNGGGANGSAVLNNETVFNDFDDDVLTGSSGLDWFLFDLANDRATDLKDEVFAADLDWILAV
jgi:uncharacterized delta-60 repeat protein